MSWNKVYYCKECKQECSVYEEDDGIGAYDYHGAPGVDIRISLSSDCCDGFVTTEPPEGDE